MSTRLMTEQPQSALNMLTEAGVKHGEDTRVLFVAGVPDGDGTVAFCPGSARVLEVPHPAAEAIRNVPLAGEIAFSPEAASVVAQCIGSKRGVVVVEATVFCNGKPLVKKVHKTKFVEVHGEDADHLRYASGRELFRHLIAQTA